MDAALDISGIEAGYGRTTVLRDLSLRVSRGEVAALLGPNGAGKTTLLRVVSGFLPATRGSVSMFGEDITSAPAISCRPLSRPRGSRRIPVVDGP
jgi:branched-chain amino acid transport system ATP-binding protein